MYPCIVLNVLLAMNRGAGPLRRVIEAIQPAKLAVAYRSERRAPVAAQQIAEAPVRDHLIF